MFGSFMGRYEDDVKIDPREKNLRLVLWWCVS
jgi:hypothetical protein